MAAGGQVRQPHPSGRCWRWNCPSRPPVELITAIVTNQPTDGVERILPNAGVVCCAS
jgi:hypothetical protein